MSEKKLESRNNEHSVRSEPYVPRVVPRRSRSVVVGRSHSNGWGRKCSRCGGYEAFVDRTVACCRTIGWVECTCGKFTLTKDKESNGEKKSNGEEESNGEEKSNGEEESKETTAGPSHFNPFIRTFLGRVCSRCGCYEAFADQTEECCHAMKWGKCTYVEKIDDRSISTSSSSLGLGISYEDRDPRDHQRRGRSRSPRR